jgi:hypothetical protein
MKETAGKEAPMGEATPKPTDDEIRRVVAWLEHEKRASLLVWSAEKLQAPDLYTKPAWLLEAEAWLESLRAAVLAEGLEWVAPVLDGGDEAFVWPHREPLRVLVFRPHWCTGELGEYVELYRRWLGSRTAGGGG